MGIGIGTRRIGATTQTRGDVRDIEVLRVSAQLISDSSGLTVPSARNAVLRWAKKRAGRRLPDPAWAFQDFEDLAAGRNISAVRIENQNRDLWAMRAEDPDKKVVGRAWSTEIVIGGEVGGPTQICLRLIISTNEASIDIEPHVPGLVLQMIDGPGLVSNDRKLVAEPVLIRTESDAHDLCDLLEDPDRRLPVFVAALPEEESESPLIDDCMLARATAGLARSYRLPVNLTWVLTQRFGSKRSVYNGAVRAYLRGFDGNDDPFRHSLILRSYLELDKANAESTVARLRSLAARASLSETRLGVDVLDFVSVRAASRKIRNQELASSSATDEEKLQATEQLVETLSKQISEKDNEIDFYISEVQESEERSQIAEHENRNLIQRIRQLTSALEKSVPIAELNNPRPLDWSEFLDWVDQVYPDKISLTSAARRMTKAPMFEDVGLVTRCIAWLATVQHETRIGGGGSLRDVSIENGIINSPCGGDEYSVNWQGRRLRVDWHVKNGGNVRDPSRCLRIYYFWEPDMQMTVIDHLPAHRKTSAT